MPERAIDRRMTVEEFLGWDDGTDTRYELEHGVPVAMAPAAVPHGTLAQNVGEEINRHVRDRPPCRAVQAAGVTVDREAKKVYVPDVLMTCEEPAAAPEVLAPRLIVEILSPTTKGIDKKQKVPAYAALSSVEEIWLVESTARWVLVWQRIEGTWVASLPVTGSGTFESRALGGEVALDRLYRLTGLETPPDEA